MGRSDVYLPQDCDKATTADRHGMVNGSDTTPSTFLRFGIFNVLSRTLPLPVHNPINNSPPHFLNLLLPLPRFSLQPFQTFGLPSTVPSPLNRSGPVASFVVLPR